MLNCQNIHTVKNTESVQEKLFVIFLKKYVRWSLLLLLATAIYSSFLHLQTMFMKQIYNTYSNASKIKRNQVSC